MQEMRLRLALLPVDKAAPLGGAWRSASKQIKHVGLLHGFGLFVRHKKRGWTNKDAIALAMAHGHAVIKAFWPTPGLIAEHGILMIADRSAIKEPHRKQAVGFC